MVVEQAITCDVVVSYKSSTDQESTKWIVLDQARKSDQKCNATILLDGRLNIIQETLLGRYKITYDPSQYKVVDFFAFQKDKAVERKIKKRRDNFDKSEQEIEHVNYNKLSWKIHLENIGSSSLNTFETLPRWKDGDQSPKDYPLAREHGSFKQLVVEVTSPGVGDTKVTNWHEARVLKLLHGEPWDPRFRLPDFLDAERTAIHAERLDELLKLGRINKGACHVEVEIIENSKVLLKIFPQNTLSHEEWPTVLHSGTTIRVSSARLFKENNGLSKSRPDSTWTAQVDYRLGRAPICALLCQKIPEADLGDYRGAYEEDFAFTPTRLDITSQRGLTALKEFEGAIPSHDIGADDIMAKLEPDNLTNSIYQLPVQQLLLENEDQPATNDDLTRSVGDLDFSSLPIGVSDEKKSAIQNVFSHSVSLIQGPPGSGKTLALAAMTESLLRHGNVTKILICSATNNVVDQIALTLKTHLTDFKIAKVVSHGAADDELLGGVDDNVHGASIHAQCMKEVEECLDGYPDYTRGSKELREKGYIAGSRKCKKFRIARDTLMERVLRNTQIVICTLASSCLPVLVNFGAEILLIDDAPRAKTYEILMPLMRFGKSLKRLVLTGDPKQLGSFFSTNHGYKQWKISLLQKLLERGKVGETWPATYLTEIYRTHEDLFEPIKELFYCDQPDIRCSTTYPDAFQKSFSDSLPIEVAGHNGRGMALTGYAHFIDVPEPETETNDIGSSWSVVESAIIIKIVEALLEMGICTLSDILIEVFYRRQVDELQSCAEYHKLILNQKDRSLAISTVHSAQGLEANVVILGLTKGGRKNLQWSMMTKPQVTDVAFSRAKNVLIVVGDWKNTMRGRRPQWHEEHDIDDPEEEAETEGNKLRQILSKLSNENPNFVIHGYKVPAEMVPRPASQLFKHRE